MLITNKGDLEDIILWPDNTWCYREELHEMTHMSDDFIVIPFGSLYYPEKITIAEPCYDSIVKTRQCLLKNEPK